MTTIFLKTGFVLLSAASLATPLHAVELNVDAMPSNVAAKLTPNTASDAGLESLKDASICAMDLMPAASNIYYAVSPKVNGDSNLRKLVKKEVRPKVFSGKLSIKAAKQHAKAASVCLKILRQETLVAQSN